jgi:Beta-lactamase
MRRAIGLRRSAWSVLLCVASCAVVFHPGAAGQSPPKKTAAPKAAATRPQHVDPRSIRIDQLFAQFARGQSPGAAVLLAVDGRVVHKRGYGFANLSTRHRIDEGTNFRQQTSMHLTSPPRWRKSISRSKLLPPCENGTNDATPGQAGRQPRSPYRLLLSGPAPAWRGFRRCRDDP